MPDLPDYNNNEPKGEWPGGSTGQKCGSVSRLYFLSFVYKASGMAVLAPVEHSSVVEQLAYIQRVPGSIPGVPIGYHFPRLYVRRNAYENKHNLEWNRCSSKSER